MPKPDRSPEHRRALRNYKIFLGTITATALFLAFFSGLQDQAKKHDEKLTRSISKISNDISKLQDKSDVSALPNDISGITKESLDDIKYKKTSDTTYELCASFKTGKKSPLSSSTRTTTSYISVYYHDKGENCYKATLNFRAATLKSSSYNTNTLSVGSSAGGSTSATCGVTGSNVLQGKVGTIDIAQKRIYQQGAATTSTNFVRYDDKTKFADKKCKTILLSQLKSGDTIYFATNLRNSQQYADIIVLQ